jgi:ABC-type transporter Mla subunit MlaD
MKIKEITETLTSTLSRSAASAVAHIDPSAVMRLRRLTSNLDQVLDRARSSSPQTMSIELRQLHAELSAVAHQFPQLAAQLTPAIAHIRSAMNQPATATTVLNQVRQILSQ